MQEQLSKNRIIIEKDPKGLLCATVTRYKFVIFVVCDVRGMYGIEMRVM